MRNRELKPSKVRFRHPLLIKSNQKHLTENECQNLKFTISSANSTKAWLTCECPSIIETSKDCSALDELAAELAALEEV